MSTQHDSYGTAANVRTTGEHLVTESQPWDQRVRRFSAGAVFAGFFTAVALQLLFSLLGIAFGFWSIDPQTESHPLDGLGMATGIWWVVTSLISLAAGGAAAGYLAGIPNSVDGGLHGVVTWGLVTVFTFWIAGSAMGSLFNAAAGAMGAGLRTAADWAVPDGRDRQVQVIVLRDGEPVSTFAQENSNQRNSDSLLNVGTVNFEQLATQTQKLLRDTGKDSLQPEQLDQATQRLADAARNAASEVAQNPDRARQSFDQVMDAALREFRNVQQDVDRDALVNLVTANTELNEQDARKAVDRWISEGREMRQEAGQLQNQLASNWNQMENQLGRQYQETKKAALSTTEEALDSVAYAALWTFLATLLGMISAATSGMAGSRYGLLRAAAVRPTSMQRP